MNKIEYLLTVLGEECAESAQRASKAIRFGMHEVQPGQPEDNRRRLEREVAEVVATAELIGLVIRDEDKSAKVEKLRRYMDYSRQIGTLEDGGDPALKKNALQRQLFCEGCGTVREKCPRIVPNPPGLACCPECSHAMDIAEKRA